MPPTLRKVSQYGGKLSPADVAEGINASRRNAKRLADDAAFMLEAKRLPSALALAILSIEESGKAGILRAIGMASTDAELKQYWKEYRSHKSKNALWAAFDYIAKGARKLDDFAGLFDPNEDHPQVLDELKQLAVYTECVRVGRWVEPTSVAEQPLVESIVTIASTFATEKMVSAEELEIYFRHLGPVRESNPGWIQQAFVNAYAEMQRRGVKPPGSNEAEDLVKGLISAHEGRKVDKDRQS